MRAIGRRDFIAGGAAAIGGLAAVGAPVRSMLGSRGTASIGTKGWTNPYMTDGLIAMWDGEWNAGGGVQSPENICLDITGNGHDGIFWGYMEHESNYFWTPTNDGTRKGALYAALTAEERDVLLQSCTVEIVCHTCQQSDFVYNSLYHRLVSVAGMLTCGMYVNGNIYYGRRTWAGNFNGGGFGATLALRLSTIGDAATIASSNGNASSWTVSDIKDFPLFGFTGGDGATPGNFNYAEIGTKFYSLRLYSRPLTAAEIAANYAVDKERFGLP